jgi:transposase
MNTACKVPSPYEMQLDLFGGTPTAMQQSELRTAVGSGRRFVAGDPRRIFLGTTKLEDYLKQVGQQAPFIIARLLDEQDWTAFEQRYAATGRAPYSPRHVMGLILYGVMQSVNSLRELERLARLDLGCMWVSGGITPDHANIGRFIVLHEASLTQDFFESLTRAILKASASSSKRLAGDGTVIEAACSHYGLLKEEAVRDNALRAREALARAPDDDNAKRDLERTEQCQKIFEARQAARQSSGKSHETLRVSATEPEAMVQRLKRGRGFAASYKPSVLVNENRIALAHAVDASSETQVMGQMLDQSKRITGYDTKELLLDAGYFHDEVIAHTLARDISLLCPAGRWPEVTQDNSLFHKSQFHYDCDSDTYRCPAGQTLHFFMQNRQTERSRAQRVYASNSCDGCALRSRCTKAVQGRRIKRYPEDEACEALRTVMQHPQARRIFSQRKAMAEPVFSSLRNQQGLDRFHRRGLRAVKREFALHMLAYNLSRAVALMALLWGIFYVLLNRLTQVGWYVRIERIRIAFCFAIKQLRPYRRYFLLL